MATETMTRAEATLALVAGKKVERCTGEHSIPLEWHAEHGIIMRSNDGGWFTEHYDGGGTYRLAESNPEPKPPRGFVFCDEPWAPDQHDSAIAWHPKYGYGYHNCLCGGTPPWRWIRPAGVPIAELLGAIDELSNTEGITAWSYRQSLHRLLDTYKNVTAAPGVPLEELRQLARDMDDADDADMCRKWTRELIAKHEGRK